MPPRGRGRGRGRGHFHQNQPQSPPIFIGHIDNTTSKGTLSV